MELAAGQQIAALSVDDHPRFRAAIAKVIKHEADMPMVDEATTAAQPSTLAASGSPT